MLTLNVRWYNDTEKRSRSLILREPKPELSAAEVEAAMDSLAALKLVATGFVTDRAAYVDRTSEVLFSVRS
jgi:hypothetical protein